MSIKISLSTLYVLRVKTHYLYIKWIAVLWKGKFLATSSRNAAHSVNNYCRNKSCGKAFLASYRADDARMECDKNDLRRNNYNLPRLTVVELRGFL